MCTFEKIINKLERYLLDNMGFYKVGGHLLKDISIDEYLISPELLDKILQNKLPLAAPTTGVIENLLIENYVSIKIMDEAIEHINWSCEEKAYFSYEGEEDEAAEELAYIGYLQIEEWVNSQDISINHKELERFIENHKNKTRKE